MDPISYKPAGDAVRVLIALPSRLAEIETTGFSTDDPIEVSLLDSNPDVVRATSASTTSAPPLPAPAAPPETSDPKGASA